MTRKDLIYKCAEAILEAMYEEFCETSSGEFARATATVDTPAGCIEIYTDSNNEAEVIVYHNGEERESPRLEAAIKDAIPGWNESREQWEQDNPFEDEWTSHGFRDEADYNRWRYTNW